MKKGSLITLTARGLYCENGDFYIDPWKPVDRAVVTHAHSDHAYRGSKKYLVAKPGEGLAHIRLWSEEDANSKIEALDYGKTKTMNGVKLSFHPAGHILGSAQVRVEYKGEVWVVSGDYKLTPDPTCAPFEPVKCHYFITEATFGLPIYRWPKPDDSIWGDQRLVATKSGARKGVRYLCVLAWQGPAGPCRRRSADRPHLHARCG